MTKKIIKYDNTGSEENVFDLRSRDRLNFFEKIPTGSQNVAWSGAFSVDITLLSERSEPLWI